MVWLTFALSLFLDIMDKELKALRNARWEKTFAEQSQESTAEDAVNRKATIVIEHLIQASDVSHTMQHWHVYQVRFVGVCVCVCVLVLCRGLMMVGVVVAGGMSVSHCCFPPSVPNRNGTRNCVVK